MSQREKLLTSIINNPKDVRIDDACKVAKLLGFTKEAGKGRHRAFSKTGEEIGLNFQVLSNGKIPKYQADQLIIMIQRYWDFDLQKRREDLNG